MYKELRSIKALSLYYETSVYRIRKLLKKAGVIVNTKAWRNPIRCKETGEVFESADCAAKKYSKTGCSSTIKKALNKKIKTAYGYHWEKIYK